MCLKERRTLFLFKNVTGRYSNAIPHRAKEMERTVTSEIRSLKKIAMMTATMTG